jgi:hypothetical protein
MAFKTPACMRIAHSANPPAGAFGANHVRKDAAGKLREMGPFLGR